jgi:hypothetical protein
VHGLDSNKNLMNMMSFALADAGFEVYSIDLPGHGDSEAPFNGLRSRRVLEAVFDRLGPDTIAIGHSFGAALLLDAANDRDFGTLVLFSPPPTTVDRLRAKRALVAVGRFDLPLISAFVPKLAASWPETIELRVVDWAGHSEYTMRPDVLRDLVIWLEAEASMWRTFWRLVLLKLIIISSVGFAVALTPKQNPALAKSAGRPAYVTLVAYIAAGAATYLLAGNVISFAWLRLFATHYLIGFACIAGLLLCIRLPRVRFTAGPLFWSLLAAVYVILIPGMLAASELVHFTMSGGRWWRFPIIVAASLPLLLADETYLRPLRPWWRAAGAVLLTRLIIAGFISTGVATLHRDYGLIVILLHLVILFWMLLWLAGEFVRARIQDPLATALFGAIVQGWLYAAVFITV